MVGPYGIPVLNALSICPEAISIDQTSPCSFRDVEHAAIDMGRDTAHHAFWYGAKLICRPSPAHAFQIATNAARGDDHCICRKGKCSDLVAVRLRSARRVIVSKNCARHAAGCAVGHIQTIDLMAIGVPQTPGLFMVRAAGHKWRNDTRPCAPGQMKARHGIAMTVSKAATALCPPDDGDPPMAQPMQPFAQAARRELQIGLGPFARPSILLAIKLC